MRASAVLLARITDHTLRATTQNSYKTMNDSGDRTGPPLQSTDNSPGSGTRHIRQDESSAQNSSDGSQVHQLNGSCAGEMETEDGLRTALSKNGAIPWDCILNSETSRVQSMKEEIERLQVLKSYRNLNQEREETFDRMTRMAARIFRARFSVISLVDLEKLWFLSTYGQDTHEAPRVCSFCSEVIHPSPHTAGRGPTPRVLVIPDASQDEYFRDKPQVTGPPGIRFYAGAPIISPEGYKVCCKF